MHNDITITLPSGWHTRRDPGHGIVVAARPRTVPASGVSPEIVLRCTPVDADLVAWRGQALRALRAQLPGFALESARTRDLAGRQVARCRFLHLLGTAQVVTDQWAWRVAEVGVTLTCSAAREDHPGYDDLFARVAATVDVLPQVA
jgi:hypothetical protein